MIEREETMKVARQRKSANSKGDFPPLRNERSVSHSPKRRAHHQWPNGRETDSVPEESIAQLEARLHSKPDRCTQTVEVRVVHKRGQYDDAEIHVRVHDGIHWSNER
jgi:hypothetical protein